MHTCENVYSSAPVENERYSLDNDVGKDQAIMRIDFVLTKDVYAAVDCPSNDSF
jgi:hypothetical protein